MKSSWPTKKLVEVCEIVRSGITPFDEEKEYIDTNSVQNFSIVKSKPVTYKDRPSRANMEAKEDDVLVAKMANTLKVYLATLQDEKKRIFSTGFFVLRPKKELTEPKYLFLYCASNLFQNLKDELARGSTQKALNDEKLKKYFEIPLPPIEIQKRIVARIEELFAKIDKAKQLREKALEETEQIFHSALQEIFDKAEKKWGMKKLGEICCINPSKSELKNLSDNLEVSFIPMSAVDDISGSIITQEKKLLGKVKKGYTYFKEDDVLFAKITPCMQNGKSAIAKNLINGLGFGSTEFHVLRPLDKVLSEWIYFYIRQPWFLEEAERHFTGTAGQQRVPQEFLERTEVPLPPLSEQKKIVDYLDDLREKVEKLKQLQQNQLEELNELKNSILDKAFKGELVG